MATRGAVITSAAVTPIKWNIALETSVGSEPILPVCREGAGFLFWEPLLTLAHLIDHHNLENDLQDHRAHVECFP